MSTTSSQERRTRTARLQNAVKTDPADAARMLQESFEAAVHAGAAGKTDGLDCRAGCHHCCFQLVSVRAPEIFRLARAIRALDAEKAAALTDHIGAIDRVTRGRSVAQRVQDRIPCPLLGSDGGCILYEERPLGCRVFASFDVKACKRLFAGLGAAVPVPAGRTEAGLALLATFDQACLAARVDAQPYELVAGLAIALADEKAESGWMRGRDSLAGARREGKTLTRQVGPTVPL